MKLTFLGATHEVTGSCTLLEACGKKILIDCGMEQGKDIYVNQPIPVAPGELDGVLLTHAHIDHSGNIPLLVKNGFSAPIWCTHATRQLCSIMLRDSAHIQEMDAEWKNRKAQRSGKPPIEPLYSIADAEEALKMFQGLSYEERTPLCDGIEVRFVDAGHLLGSASIEVWITEEGKTVKVVFSGDIGNNHQPLIRDPQLIQEADYIVMESTYGDRTHGERPDYVTSLAGILQRTFDRGGNVIIPSFAVGRTQEMLYFIREIKEKNLVHGHDDFPVVVDSPLANEATNIFKANFMGCYDEEAMALVKAGINPISFNGLSTSVSSEESKAINFDPTPKVILSASGMCEAGRIRHHLKHNLWRPECTVLFVGYQANGTLGRALVEGASEVKLFGEDIEVHAEITQLPGISGHADKDGLLAWAAAFDPKPKHAIILHGEDSVTDIFAARLKNELGIEAFAPFSGTEFDLSTGDIGAEAKGKRIEKTVNGSDSKPVSPNFRRLLEAGKRLMEVINGCSGMPNKDLARFADQIQSMCDKWAIK